MNQQKMIRVGILEEKRRELEKVTISLQAKINSFSCMIMPEMDIEDQKFEYAEGVIMECQELKAKYDLLKKEIKSLEDAI